MYVDPATFLPHLDGMRFDHIEVTPQLITLTVSAVRKTAPCPRCATASADLHAYYTRTVADLPWSGQRVTLRVRTRRFVCHVAACARKIFCERLTQFVAVYGRRAHTLRTWLERIGLALGGRAGARHAASQATP